MLLLLLPTTYCRTLYLLLLSLPHLSYAYIFLPFSSFYKLYSLSYLATFTPLLPSSLYVTTFDPFHFPSYFHPTLLPFLFLPTTLTTVSLSSRVIDFTTIYSIPFYLLSLPYSTYSYYLLHLLHQPALLYLIILLPSLPQIYGADTGD